MKWRVHTTVELCCAPRQQKCELPCTQTEAMNWELSHRADQRARRVADRHYNRQSHGSPQFVPPGRCCVLYANEEDAQAL
jgi:hypothetical protein